MELNKIVRFWIQSLNHYLEVHQKDQKFLYAPKREVYSPSEGIYLPQTEDTSI